MESEWGGLSEIRPVLRLALPVIASNGLQFVLQIIDAAFLGHLGPTELAAAALGNAYFRCVALATWFGSGVCSRCVRLASLLDAGSVVGTRPRRHLDSLGPSLGARDPSSSARKAFACQVARR
eukprot:scaffold263777_cov40-Tisochrysis_lutea.AAC.1